VPLTSIRRITAQRLTESATAPHFYLTAVTDADPLLALLAEVNTSLASVGYKISLTDFLIRACDITLRHHPHVNASWAVTICSCTDRCTSGSQWPSTTG
jgi:pyruvate dehydrogenase E2 component (dihydrolipoamide acetyltransferase)